MANLAVGDRGAADAAGWYGDRPHGRRHRLGRTQGNLRPSPLCNNVRRQRRGDEHFLRRGDWLRAKWQRHPSADAVDWSGVDGVVLRQHARLDDQLDLRLLCIANRIGAFSDLHRPGRRLHTRRGRSGSNCQRIDHPDQHRRREPKDRHRPRLRLGCHGDGSLDHRRPLSTRQFPRSTVRMHRSAIGRQPPSHLMLH